MAALETAPQTADPGEAVSARHLVILGAGEHGRVVADAARSTAGAWLLAGFAAPADQAGPRASFAAATGLDWLGDDESVAASLASRGTHDRPAVILGFGGAPAARAAAVARFEPATEWATVVHATAWISPSATVEPGAVVLAGAIVNAGARVGRHAIVNSAAVVEHDVRLGAFVHVAPGAVLGGGVQVGDGAHIGLGAAIRDHVTIGARATVGMGAVVVGDVAAGTTVVGNPARPASGDVDG